MLVTCYGAGPDVFFPNAQEILGRKAELCARRGILLRVPIDNEIDLHSPDAATRVYRANRAMMMDCDICIANLSPFRGPSADDGTSFEAGFFDAMRRPLFVYSNAAGNLADRTRAFLVGNPDPLNIESFGLPTNLMMPCAALDRGGLPIFTATEKDRAYDDLAVFERAVGEVAERCRPIGHLRAAVSSRVGDEAAVAWALRLQYAELDGATPLEVAIADPSAVSSLMGLVTAQASGPGLLRNAHRPSAT
ncbi:nucleoside 2-deoxyribosyltransferase [Roseomonas xinghualingensis]|uniref:nucleoside 2-deoxyribosyltransferase n=1 Tax=Roseomonas xinghualingensis TaxID=2986475 RepID=UPI0021F16D41|nr:nucleoside 2-deoxyribosyltransferase [Roseomonas sp. SXEYE001]MCV4210140.1 nucleoside 2-deoxyribosyltransferase [Roseomonas sp. SXEYE001]